jgi:hypothetical protein
MIANCQPTNVISYYSTWAGASFVKWWASQPTANCLVYLLATGCPHFCVNNTYFNSCGLEDISHNGICSFSRVG